MPRLIKFPHIDQLRHIAEEVRMKAQYHSVELPTLKFRGSVKLHGANTSVCRDMATRETWCQSRETILTPQDDYKGFAQFCSGRMDHGFEHLFKTFGEGLRDGVISIYGEWCGQGMSNGAGINQLEKMYVIFGIKYTQPVESLNWIDIKVREPRERQHIIGRDADYNTWQEGWKEDGAEPLGAMTHWVPTDDAAGTWLNSAFTKVTDALTLADMKQHRIFDINEFPTYEVNLDFKNLQASIDDMIKLTSSVEASCPVAQAFDVVAGVGEGIVWTCTQDWFFDGGVIRADFRFKTKGEKHKESVNDKPTADPVKVANVQKFVEGTATAHRFEKMLEKLKLAGVAIQVETTGQFLKLVGEDILREEGDVLVVSGLDRKDVMSSVNHVAKNYWMIQVNGQAV